MSHRSITGHRRIIARPSLVCAVACIGLWLAGDRPVSAQTTTPARIAAFNPREDILPHPIYDAWLPYRKAYNRPRFLGGMMARLVEPTSQEAMAWEESWRSGEYRRHEPGLVKIYYHPKPWEVLQTGPRVRSEALGERTIDASDAWNLPDIDGGASPGEPVPARVPAPIFPR
jgi:hypothetical protein